MGNKKRKTKKDDLTILKDLIDKVLKMREAEKNGIESILTVMKRLANDQNIKKMLEDHQKATEQLQEAKDLIVSVRKLLSKH